MDSWSEPPWSGFVAGEPFGEICGEVADLEPAGAPAEAGALLARWVEDGLIAGVG